MTLVTSSSSCSLGSFCSCAFTRSFALFSALALSEKSTRRSSPALADSMVRSGMLLSLKEAGWPSDSYLIALDCADYIRITSLAIWMDCLLTGLLACSCYLLATLDAWSDYLLCGLDTSSDCLLFELMLLLDFKFIARAGVAATWLFCSSS